MSQDQENCKTPKNVPQEMHRRGLKILGDFWLLHVVVLLRDQVLRFSEIERGCGSISPSLLSDRLKKLEALGFISRKTETIDKLSVTYELTEKGKALLPILKDIYLFSENYLV